MKKLFIHIGLPKTGTTTLQRYYFPFIDTFHYCGVHQPRKEQRHQNDRTYRQVMQYVNGGGNQVKLETVLDTIKTSVDSQLLISEEMITVSKNWIQKLHNLSEIIKSFDDYTIIVTVRDPLKVSFSYYVETYERHFASGKISYLEAVKNSVHMQMYHYEYLFDTLHSIFQKDKVIALKFEDIFFDNGESLSKIFGFKPQGGFPAENKTKSEKSHKLSNRGNKVDIPSDETFEEAKIMLNYSHWESFIPSIPEGFAAPKAIEKITIKSHFEDLQNIFLQDSKSAQSPDILREVALAFEKDGDIKTALTIMEKAHILRPNGPFIKKKFEEYQKKVQLTR